MLFLHISKLIPFLGARQVSGKLTVTTVVQQMFMMPEIAGLSREEASGISPFKGADALSGLPESLPQGTNGPVPEAIAGGHFLSLLQLLSEGFVQQATEREGAVPPADARGLTATTRKDGAAEIVEAGYAQYLPVPSAALPFFSVWPEGSEAGGREALPQVANGPTLPAPTPGRMDAAATNGQLILVARRPDESPNRPEALRPCAGLATQDVPLFYSKTDAAGADPEPGRGDPIPDSRVPAPAGRAVNFPDKGSPILPGEGSDPGRPEETESGGAERGDKEVLLPVGRERPQPAGSEVPRAGRQLTAPDMISRPAAPLPFTANPTGTRGAAPQDETIHRFHDNKSAFVQPPSETGRAPGRADETAVQGLNPGELEGGTLVEDQAAPARREVFAYLRKEERIFSGPEAAGVKGKTIPVDSGSSAGGPPVTGIDVPAVRGKLSRTGMFTAPEGRDDIYAAGGVPLFREQGTCTPEARSFLAQVAEQLPQALGTGSGRVKISLHPEHMGKLDMEVLLRDNKVQIVLTADNREVQQTLQAHQEQLKEALQQQGTQVDGFSVLLQDGRPGQGDASGGGNAPGWDNDRASGGKKVMMEEAILPETASGLARHNGRSGGGVVNLFV